jgi:hypothetical protein
MLKSAITNTTNLVLLVQKTPVKNTQISCKKSGKTKVINGANPKCPTGYKKV